MIGRDTTEIMNSSSDQFFSELHQHWQQFLSGLWDIKKNRPALYFSRSPIEHFISPDEPLVAGSFLLTLSPLELLPAKHVSTLQISTPEEVIVMRSPRPMTFEVTVKSGKIPSSAHFRYISAFWNYYFDNPRPPSFIPSYAEAYPALREFFQNTPSEWDEIRLDSYSILEEGKGVSAGSGLLMKFKLCCPYHNGAILNREKRVTRKDLSINL